MRIGTLLAILALQAPLALAGNNSPLEVYSSLESQSYSEIAPIKQILDDLKGKPVSSGQFAFTHNQFEMGQRRDGIELSYFVRYDYLLKFNSDTARLAYLLRNDVAIADTEQFDVYLRANHLFAEGLGLAWLYEGEGAINGRLRVNYLQARKTTNGYLKGELSTFNDSYQADLVLDYAYSRDSLLDRPEQSNRGHGFSLDFDLHWQLHKDISLSLIGRDALSFIRFKDLSFTRAQGNSDNISYDPNGSINAKPTISGVEDYRNQSQRLPARYLMQAHHQFAAGQQWGASLFSYSGYVFPRVSYGQGFGPVSSELEYDFRSQAWGLSLRHHYLSLSLSSDRIDLERAAAFTLSINVNLKI